MKAKSINELQLFTLSKEESNCTLIPEMLQLGKNILNLLGKSKEKSVTITMSYGKRVISTTSNTPINHLSRTDFIEIVDYDPIRNILLYIGPNQPDETTPLHWMIHKAKQEIIVAVLIREEPNEKEIAKKTMQTVQEGKTHLETAKNILKGLQKKSIIHIQDKGVLITSDTTDKIIDMICTYKGKEI